MADLSRIKVKKQTSSPLSILSPYDVTAEYSTLPWDEFIGDSHYALQFCIVLHGAAELIFDDDSRIFREGEIWWNMCWEPHAYRLAGRHNFIVAVNLDVEQLGACSPFSGCNWLTPFVEKSRYRYSPDNDEDREYVHRIGRELYHMNRKQPVNWKINSWLMIHQLLLHAIQRMNENPGPSRKDRDDKEQNTFTRIRYALNQVWSTASRPPSLTEAAEMCSLSPSRFSELFRKTMGVSYGRFALRVRMSNAAKDLLSGQFTLDEVSRKWNFFDTAHFCHAFKKFYRVSPGQFAIGKPGIKSEK